MTMTMRGEGGGGGGWAAIARKEAAVEQKIDIPSLLSTAGLKTVVVDANAIIGGGIRLSGIADQYFTVKEVLQEVRDPASRFHLVTLPVEIRCVEPSEESLSKVVQFSRGTGDLQALSEVDLKLIALTYTLEAQVHGTDHIRTQPPPLTLTPSSKGYRSKDPPGWGSVANPEEWEAIDEDGEDVNTGSRILGVKELSLDDVGSISAGDTRVSGTAREREQTPKPAVTLGSKSDGNISSEASTTESFPPRHSEGIPSAVSSVHVSHVNDSHVEKGALGTSGSSSQDFIVVEGKKISVGVDPDNGDDWERALSRSTKRLYMKRAARKAARQEYEESLAAQKEAVKSNNGSAEQGAAQAVAFFRSDLSSGTGGEKEGTLLADNGCDFQEVRDGGLSDEEGQIDGDENFDDESHFDDSVSNADTTSGLNSEQNWSIGPTSTSSIACMTGDYAMQNVILQMGLRLLSTSGQHIKELNKWILKCQACGKTTNESGRLFCPKCGNGGTLFKVAITVGPNGSVHAGRNRRPILRGTRYSLPLPKGGREGAIKNPILREDQLPAKPHKVKKPEFEAFSSSDVVFSLSHERKGSKGAGVRTAAAIYGGRRNPNERRKIAK